MLEDSKVPFEETHWRDKGLTDGAMINNRVVARKGSIMDKIYYFKKAVKFDLLGSNKPFFKITNHIWMGYCASDRATVKTFAGPNHGVFIKTTGRKAILKYTITGTENHP